MASEATSLDQVSSFTLSTLLDVVFTSLLSSASRIDHFSSLPDELLDHIFEYAYESSSPQGPLSRHLLPFFERHFYRKVSLSSTTLPLFVTTVTEAPRLGQIVKDLSLSGEQGDRSLAKLLLLLPNLINLNLPLFSIPSLVPGTLMPTRLSYLSATIRRPTALQDRKMSVDAFSRLAIFPSLSRLRVYDWSEESCELLHRSPTTILDQITRLEVVGITADMETVRFVIDACPSLLHLELYSTWNSGIEFICTLPHLPITLQSLHLRCEGRPTPFDHRLSRFIQLGSIRLGDRCYSSAIHTALVQLPLLTHIHLGSGSLYPVGFHSLVTGATRLPSLRTITLDFYTLQEGERSQRPHEIVRGDNGEMRLGIEMRDWRFPAEWNGAPLDVGAYEELERIAKENGIAIDGTIKVALDWCRNYHLESNNRAVLDAYHRQDLTHLRRIRSSAAEAGVTLPNIDFDTLDIDRLEIVEIDLPEQGWWMLSLRNKE